MIKLNANQLEVFAYHVKTIVEAKPNDKFSLSFWGVASVDIVCSQGQTEPQFQLDDEHVGNAYGAIQAYIRMIIESNNIPILYNRKEKNHA